MQLLSPLPCRTQATARAARCAATRCRGVAVPPARAEPPDATQASGTHISRLQVPVAADVPFGHQRGIQVGQRLARRGPTFRLSNTAARAVWAAGPMSYPVRHGRLPLVPAGRAAPPSPKVTTARHGRWAATVEVWVPLGQQVVWQSLSPSPRDGHPLRSAAASGALRAAAAHSPLPDDGPPLASAHGAAPPHLQRAGWPHVGRVKRSVLIRMPLGRQLWISLSQRLTRPGGCAAFTDQPLRTLRASGRSRRAVVDDRLPLVRAR
jgi:hypothetical protein